MLFTLDPLPGLVQNIGIQLHHLKEIEHYHYLSSAEAVLKPVTLSMAPTSVPFSQSGSRSANQILNTALDQQGTMSSSRAGPNFYLTSVRSTMTVTYVVSGLGMLPDVLIDGQNRDPVKPCVVVDQQALLISQHRVVRVVP